MTNHPVAIEPIGRRTFGTHLTKRELIQFSLVAVADAAARDPSLVPEISRIVALAFPTPEEVFGKLEHWAVSKLRSLGLPDRPGNVEECSDGSWRWWDCASPSKGTVSCCTAFFYVQQQGEETEAWFASKILENIETLKQDLPVGIKFMAALLIGNLQRDHSWKFNHEGAAEEGIKLQEGRRRGQPRAAAATSARAKDRQQAVTERTRELWESQPDLRGNFSCTAAEIEKMQLKALQLSPIRFLGVDRIRKLISNAYKNGLLA